MAVLFRTKAYLTLDQLADAWARELMGSEKAPEQFERDLSHLLMEDAANGRLDEAGPFVEGQRLGLRIITSDFRAGFLEGERLLGALRSGANPAFLRHRIVVTKEAALFFAQRHNLPPPSWWQSAAVDFPVAPKNDLIGATASLAGTSQKSADMVSSPRRVGRARKLERVKQDMIDDIRQSRLTSSQLRDMLEKELSGRYRVSRDTARKARNAVLSESFDKIDKRQLATHK